MHKEAGGKKCLGELEAMHGAPCLLQAAKNANVVRECMSMEQGLVFWMKCVGLDGMLYPMIQFMRKRVVHLFSSAKSTAKLH
jgi:hypothetical protein